MVVVCKFECTSVQEKRDGSGADIFMRPVTSGDAENALSFSATPYGSLHMGAVDPAAAAQFESGAEYTLTFNRA